MCLSLSILGGNYLTVSEAAKALIKTAEKDIIAWKVLHKTAKGYMSVYQNFKYQMGEHYYQSGKKFTFHRVNFITYGYLQIHQGLHAYTSKRVALENISEGNCIRKFIIPKGSQYFISKEDGEIVSDNLIFPHQ